MKNAVGAQDMHDTKTSSTPTQAIPTRPTPRWGGLLLAPPVAQAWWQQHAQPLFMLCMWAAAMCFWLGGRQYVFVAVYAPSSGCERACIRCADSCRGRLERVLQPRSGAAWGPWPQIAA